MLIKCFSPQELTKDSESVSIESNSDPVVVISYEDLDDRGSMGTQVAQIDVVRKDGSLQRFWVKVCASKQGRVECTVACNDLGKSQSRRKSIFGSWFKRVN